MEAANAHKYTSHIKKVLKSYQLTAKNSLSGPSLELDNSLVVISNDSEKHVGSAELHLKTEADDSGKGSSGSDYNPFLSPPPFPIQQQPILTAPDRSRSELVETLLEGEPISCFIVGGEKRLCFPQILNTVLREFSLSQINQVCEELQIFCSRCSQEQLEVLKGALILPNIAPSCGLITKTDSERLCSVLLQKNPPRLVRDPPLKLFNFYVYHECFGKCKGICTPDLYGYPDARCIECAECHGMLSPKRFVRHAHGSLERRTCHWGFDSANWRFYLLLGRDQEDFQKLRNNFEEFKARFDPISTTTSSTKRKRELSEKEEVAMKRGRCEPPSFQVYSDPCMYWYMQYGRMPLPRPWSPVYSKDGRVILATGPSAASKDGAVPAITPVPAVPLFLSNSPPVLLNPERVVPLEDSVRFERSYQPNVALAPPEVQKARQQCVTKQPKSSPRKTEDCKGNVSMIRVTSPKKLNERAETFISKVQICRKQEIVDNEEFELSTDTDESEENGDADTVYTELQSILSTMNCEKREKLEAYFEKLSRRMSEAEYEKDRAVGELERQRENECQLMEELAALHRMREEDKRHLATLETEVLMLRRQLITPGGQVSVITSSPMIKEEIVI